MKIARYLVLATLGGSLLLIVALIRAQETRPVIDENGFQRYTQQGPAANNLLYPVPAYGGRDYRDVEADQQVQSLVKKLGEAKDEAAKTDLQKKLTEVLGKQFDVRQEARERELKELEERVKRLRDVLDKRQKAKDAIVRSHLDQLLRDADGLGWGDHSPDGKNFPSPNRGFGAGAPQE